MDFRVQQSKNTSRSGLPITHTHIPRQTTGDKFPQ
jgi:hypothetical protein